MPVLPVLRTVERQLELDDLTKVRLRRALEDHRVELRHLGLATALRDDALNRPAVLVLDLHRHPHVARDGSYLAACEVRDVAAGGGALREEAATPELDVELVTHISGEDNVGESEAQAERGILEER